MISREHKKARTPWRRRAALLAVACLLALTPASEAQAGCGGSQSLGNNRGSMSYQACWRYDPAGLGRWIGWTNVWNHWPWTQGFSIQGATIINRRWYYEPVTTRTLTRNGSMSSLIDDRLDCGSSWLQFATRVSVPGIGWGSWAYTSTVQTAAC
jgi:hypothetical protein